MISHTFLKIQIASWLVFWWLLLDNQKISAHFFLLSNTKQNYRMQVPLQAVAGFSKPVVIKGFVAAVILLRLLPTWSSLWVPPIVGIFSPNHQDKYSFGVPVRYMSSEEKKLWVKWSCLYYAQHENCPLSHQNSPWTHLSLGAMSYFFSLYNQPTPVSLITDNNFKNYFFWF